MPSTSGRPTAATSRREAKLVTSRSPARDVEGVWGNREVPPHKQEEGGQRGGNMVSPTRARRSRATSPSAESTAPARVLLDRGPELLRPEVGPERVGEDVLGVGGLPEEEVRDAALARRADHEVRVRHLGL